MEAEGVGSSSLQSVLFAFVPEANSHLESGKCYNPSLWRVPLYTPTKERGDKPLNRREVAGFHLENSRAAPGHRDCGNFANGQSLGLGWPDWPFTSGGSDIG